MKEVHPIVVTGASGYLGRKLVRRLWQEDLEVIPVDLDGDNPVDLTSRDAPGLLEKIIPSNFDLIHLAFPLPGYLRKADFRQFSQESCRSILSLRTPPRRTLFLSSTAVFSPNTFEAPSPWESYGRAKLDSEKRLACLPEFSIIRPGTLIDSTRMSPVSRLFRRALRGEAVPLPARGKLAHPFLHVDDLVAECVKWATARATRPQTVSLWARDAVSVSDFLTQSELPNKIWNLPSIAQTLGWDSVPILGVSRWHLRALSYDVNGIQLDSGTNSETRAMSQLFEELRS